MAAIKLVWRLLGTVGYAINEFHAHNGDSAPAAPTRSVRRATARRASKRRATARSRQVDVKARIIDFLARNPWQHGW